MWGTVKRTVRLWGSQKNLFIAKGTLKTLATNSKKTTKTKERWVGFAIVVGGCL